MLLENENKIAYNFIPAPTKLFYVLNKDCYSLLLLLIEKESYWKTKEQLKDGYFYITISDISEILDINQKDINLLIETLYINNIINVISEGTSGHRRTNKYSINWDTVNKYDKYTITDIKEFGLKIEKLKRGTKCTYFSNSTIPGTKCLTIANEEPRTKCLTIEIEEPRTKCLTIEIENTEVKTNCTPFLTDLGTEPRTKCLTTIDNIDNTEEKKENIKKELTYVSNTSKPRLTNIEGTNVDFFENYLEVEDLNLSELNELNLTDIEGTRVNSLTNYSSKEKADYSTEESLNLTNQEWTSVNSLPNSIEEEEKPSNYSTEKESSLPCSTGTYINSFFNYLEEEEEEKETSEAITYSTEKESSFTDIKTNVNSLPLFEEEKTLNYSTEKESSLTCLTETSEAIIPQPKNVLKVEDISEAKKETPLVALVPPLNTYNKPLTKTQKLEQMKEEELIKVYASLLHATNNGTDGKSLIIAYNLINDMRNKVSDSSILNKHDLAEVYYTFSDNYFDTIVSQKRLTNYIYGLEDDDEELDEAKMLNIYYSLVVSKYDKDKVKAAVTTAIEAAKKHA